MDANLFLAALNGCRKAYSYGQAMMIAISFLLFLGCSGEGASNDEKETSQKESEVSNTKPEPVKEKLDGLWYEQVYRGVIVHHKDGKPLTLEVAGDGVYRGPSDDSYLVETPFDHDPQSQFFSLRSPTSDYEEKYQYSFDDEGVLSVWQPMQDGSRRKERQYTRNIEGTVAHQKTRAADLLPYGGKQQRYSQESLRIIAWSSYRHSQSKQSIFPDSIGFLVAKNYFPPDRTLAPWSDKSMPEQFNDLPEPDQIDWINHHSGYVYLAGGKRVRGGDQLIAFELVPVGKLDQVGIATFSDVLAKQRQKQTRRIPYDQADTLVKAQTGYSIAQWQNAKSPGTGQMTLENDLD